MRSKLAVLVLVAALAIPARASAQGGSISASDQAIQQNTVAVEVTADSQGWAVVTTGDGATVLGQTLVAAGTKGRVTVKIDITKATPELKATLHSASGATFDPNADKAVGEGKAFKVVGVQPVDFAENQLTELTLPRVIAQADGFVALLPVIPERDEAVAFGTAAVKAGVNENVKVKVDDPGKTVSRPLTVGLFTDEGEKGKFEFPGADKRVVLGNVVVGEPITIGDRAVRAGDALVTDGKLVVPAANSPFDGWLVLQTQGSQTQVLGSAAVKPGVNNDVVIEIKASGPLPSRAFLTVYEDKGEKGKFEVPGADGELEAPDLNPFSYAVLLNVGIQTYDQRLEVVKAQGGIIIARAIATESSWIRIVSTKDFSDPKDILTFLIGSGVHRNVFIPVSDMSLLEVDLQLLTQLSADKGEPGKYEFDENNTADQPLKDATGATIRSQITFIP